MNKQRNYLIRHWRGELSLGVALWLNGVLVGALGFGIYKAVALIPKLGRLEISAAYVLISLIACLGLAGWYLVGAWRSASRQIIIGKPRLWARLTQIFLVLALGVACVVGRPAMPVIVACWEIVTGDKHIPAYKIQVLPGGTEVAFTGGFRAGATRDLKRVLDAHPQIKMLRISSPGGRTEEGLLMGRLVRERGLNTFTSQDCVSAATYVFIAGKERLATTQAYIGFHTPEWFTKSADGRPAGHEEFRQTMIALGYSESFSAKAATVPHQTVWYPLISELVQAGVVTRQVSPLEVESPDPSKAILWYRLAAQEGYADAQAILADCYQNGVGVKQDEAETVKWRRLAAEQGMAREQFDLGRHYFWGQGVKADKGKAARWLTKSAEQGYRKALAGLSDCYVQGWGVKSDYVQAYKWLRLAVDLGGTKYVEDLAKLKQRLTAKQIAEGDRQVRKFKANLGIE